MSYEAVSGLGQTAFARMGFPGAASTATASNGADNLPPVPRGEVRVPVEERGALKAWYERYQGRSSFFYQNWLGRDPTFSTSQQTTLDLFRKTRRRVELIAAKQGVLCISGPIGATSGPRWQASKTLRWWKDCDLVGWSIWNPQSMSQVSSGDCTSVPTSLLNYWIEGYRLRPAAVGCPLQTVKNVIFGFNALEEEAARAPASLMHIYQTIPIFGKVPQTEDEASGQAAEQGIEIARDAAGQKKRPPLWTPSKPPPPPPPPPTSVVGQGPGDSTYLSPQTPESEESVEPTTEQPRDTGKYLMWGAVGLVAAGGIGYLVYKYLKKPKTPPGFKGNPEDEGFGVRLRTDAPRDVKMVVKAMNRSARSHLGEGDPRAVRWSFWPDGRWVVSDNFDRRKAALVRELDGSWTLHDYTARITERLTQSKAERVAGMFFRGL
jgi:hypothetical protein